ncbi:hypothetical protein J3A83DRAFT_4092994, partial [Scleroderma citrinum]
DCSQLDMHIEFKQYSWDDSFLMPPQGQDRSTALFIGSTKNERATLGQIGAYAAVHLASQFHTHCFSVYIAYHTAHIIQWDREGEIVTNFISFEVDNLLIEFFSQYCQTPSELCGVDTTISCALEDKAMLARDVLCLPSDMAMFKTTLPRSGGGPPFLIISPCPDIMTTIPTCCSTHTCPAYSPSEKCHVFFKDLWHVDADDITPEGEIHAVLDVKHVSFVSTCLACSDVTSDFEQKMQMV